MFVGRTIELATLKAKFDSRSSEIGIIHGQRRIGKTSLVKESLKGRDSLYFLCADTTGYDNLVHFSSTLNDYIGLPSSYIYPSFKEFFMALAKEVYKRKTIVFFDELPFLVKAYPAALTLLQEFIDFGKEEGLKLILSGSDVGFMVELLHDKKGPLYQRQTFDLEVRPLSFSDSLKMLPGLTKEEKIAYLCLFGGRPLYLSLLDLSKSFDENVESLFFSRGGALVEAPMLTLPLGRESSGVYVAIYNAIASRKKRQGEIAEYTKVKANNLTTYLDKLIMDRIIVKNEYFNANRHGVYYDFYDPLFSFYYLYVYRNVELIRAGAGKKVYEGLKNEIASYIGLGFEKVVLSYMEERNVTGELGELFEPFKRLILDNSPLGRSVEFDGISKAVFDPKSLLIVEAKYRNAPVGVEVLDHLKESASVLKGHTKVSYYLFSKSGFTKELMEKKEEDIHLISVSDMVK